MRIVLVGAGVLLLIGAGIGIYLFLSPEPETEQVVTFPQAGTRDVETMGNELYYPDRPPGYVEVSVEEVPQATAAPAPSAPVRTVATAPAPAPAPSLDSLIDGLVARYRSSEPAPTVTYTPPPEQAPTTGEVGVRYSPQPTTYSVPTYDGTGQNFGYGCPGTVTFDATSGDLAVGNARFNFLTNTSDLGANIGRLVGALTCNPSFGTTLGVALTSNLSAGRSAAELGITIKDGVPYFGSYNAIEEGGIFRGGGSIGAMRGDQFDGYVFAMPCTCSKTVLKGMFTAIVAPSQYVGTYVVHPLAITYRHYGDVGFFRASGIYRARAVPDGCSMNIGGTCQDITIDRGIIGVK